MFGDEQMVFENAHHILTKQQQCSTHKSWSARGARNFQSCEYLASLVLVVPTSIAEGCTSKPHPTMDTPHREVCLYFDYTIHTYYRDGIG